MLVSTEQKQNTLRNRLEELYLKLRYKEVEVIQETKYHGVEKSTSLNWKEHIKKVSARVSRAIGCLQRPNHAKTFLPLETLNTLYIGIVEPHFRYCCSV